MKYQKPEAEVIKFDENSQFMTGSSEAVIEDNTPSTPDYSGCVSIIYNTPASGGAVYCTFVNGQVYPAGGYCYVGL